MAKLKENSGVEETSGVEMVDKTLWVFVGGGFVCLFICFVMKERKDYVELKFRSFFKMYSPPRSTIRCTTEHQKITEC